MIRIATLEDVPRITAMGMEFAKQSKIPQPIAEDMAEFAANLIEMDDGVIFVSDSGFIAGFVAPIYYRKDYLQAHEVAWWSTDSSGLRLLAKFERWAKDKSASEIVLSMISGYSPKPLTDLFERKGYGMRDLTYTKELT